MSQLTTFPESASYHIETRIEIPQICKPVLLIDVSRVLRSYGTIWNIAKTDYGTLFRACLTGQQVRVLSQLPGAPAPNFPPDSLAPLHVVEDLSTLISWLDSFGTCSGNGQSLLGNISSATSKPANLYE